MHFFSEPLKIDESSLKRISLIQDQFVKALQIHLCQAEASPRLSDIFEVSNLLIPPSITDLFSFAVATLASVGRFPPTSRENVLCSIFNLSGTHPAAP